MRVAIDTNCLIAALTKRHGSCARMVQAWLDGQLEVVASEDTAREAEQVLGRWLTRMVGRREVDELVKAIRTRTAWVDAPAAITDLSLRDAGDLRMVETAVAGGARYIVTTDREFLSHRGYDTVEFATPDEVLARLRGAVGSSR